MNRFRCSTFNIENVFNLIQLKQLCFVSLYRHRIYYVLRCVVGTCVVLFFFFFFYSYSNTVHASSGPRINYRQGACGKRQEVSYPIQAANAGHPVHLVKSPVVAVYTGVVECDVRVCVIFCYTLPLHYHYITVVCTTTAQNKSSMYGVLE